MTWAPRGKKKVDKDIDDDSQLPLEGVYRSLTSQRGRVKGNRKRGKCNKVLGVREGNLEH